VITAPRIMLATALAMLYCAAALGAETAPDQPSPRGDVKPFGEAKPVTTTIIKRCPDGYELVIRANGGRGCAKDVVPAND